MRFAEYGDWAGKLNHEHTHWPPASAAGQQLVETADSLRVAGSTNHRDASTAPSTSRRKICLADDDDGDDDGDDDESL